ncbi:GNAT family N-acetyltransferase [Rhizobium sp. BK379]|uniref:GNAT family N-acetyltransferase n=1 Tax=Rhizobium sp. BK379 TaxID=2587059 RepID=UPI001615B84D|nr:GNAT family N-acetyltransferase [Rhizobium sp. BK379]MBB3441848.1 GNAT superfamily N-acetyltransferase/predicted nucleic acid-binding protein [Rhizobium sp. BK379]
MSNRRFVIKKDIEGLVGILSEIQALADSQRNALGFLPETAFRDAIVRRRLFAMVSHAAEKEVLAGYLLFSGVFPNAKIQQIAVAPEYRSAGVASALMNTLVADLEARGFMALRADVASDLTQARSFYARNGFEIVTERAGGQARSRKILVHVRELENDSLFSLANQTQREGLDLGIRRRSAGNSPIYAFDLNVFFDLVKERQHSDAARQLFSAALGHDLRLVVADEFAKELAKRSRDVKSDPILQMALALPRLPNVSIEACNGLADEIHDLVFTQRKHRDAGTVQARSDAQHLAHAALTRASAFITRDEALIGARDELLANVGIDVISLDELVSLLPAQAMPQPQPPVSGREFSFGQMSPEDARRYLSSVGVNETIIAKACPLPAEGGSARYLGFFQHGNTLAIGSLRLPRSIEPTGELLVHVRPEHPESGLFAEYLLDVLIREACEHLPIRLALEHLPGQTIVNQVAKSRGFVSSGSSGGLAKVALGRPLTNSNWARAAQELRRRAGLTIPTSGIGDKMSVIDGSGKNLNLSLQQLETLLSPTLIVGPDREGVIVPITKAYADELLGTNRQQQFSFVESGDAAFLSKRGYVNDPRSSKLIRPDMPILFYESKRDGKGRGAVVAGGRVVDSLIMKKSEISTDGMRRLVVDDVDRFSKTSDVLLTTFDNLMVFPHPVMVKKLKEFDAMGRANLVSPVALNSDRMSKIFAEGWPIAT